MKGVAIVLIPLHNLLHMVGPLVRENEFYYNYPRRAYWMWNHITHLHPNVVGDAISFFGWYGVPVFMFLSGYGVMHKYGNPAEKCAAFRPFLRYNFLKLFRLMAPAFLLYCLIQMLFSNGQQTVVSFFTQLTLTNNILCNPKDIDPGVYWYFGITLQFYLLYRLLFHRKSNRVFWSLWALLLAADTLWLICMLPDPALKVQPQFEYIRHNAVGWFLPYFMGLGMGRLSLGPGSTCPEKNGHRNTLSRGALCSGFVASVLLLSACSFQQQLWLVTPVFAITGTICLMRLIRHAWIGKMFGRLGTLSAYVFVVHPLVRPFFKEWIFLPGQLEIDVRGWFLAGLYLCLSVALAYLYKVLISKIPY